MLSPRRRQRLLQIGFVIGALAAVLVADRTAGALGGTNITAARLGSLLVVGGRVVGGWALGMAFRLQFVRTTHPDQQLRLLLAVPAAALCAWPVLRTMLPGEVIGALPGWMLSGVPAGLTTFAAVLLGLTLSLAVSGSRRG